MTTLRITVSAAYLFEATLLGVSMLETQWMIDSGHTFVGFLLGSSSEGKAEKKETVKVKIFRSTDLRLL